MKLIERVAVIETDIKHFKEKQLEFNKTQEEILLELQRLNTFKWYLSGAAMAIGFFVTIFIELGRMILEKHLNIK